MELTIILVFAVIYRVIVNFITVYKRDKFLREYYSPENHDKYTGYSYRAVINN